jgi:hypothetical protein
MQTFTFYFLHIQFNIILSSTSVMPSVPQYYCTNEGTSYDYFGAEVDIWAKEGRGSRGAEKTTYNEELYDLC